MSITVEALSVRRRRHASPVLHDVSFSIAGGSILGVGGPSGSGKSTLLATLAGLVRPASGRIELAGIASRRPRDLARIVGYVGADDGVEADLTPAEHLRFHASLRGIGRKERAGLVAGLIELVDLGEWRDVPGRLLTAGLRRRVAIARAMVHDPAVVLIDDPAVGLDPAARADLVELLGGLGDAGRTVVVAGGDLDDFAGCITSLAVLDRGGLAAFGHPDAVLGSADGRRQVRVRLADGSEHFYDVDGPGEQRQLIARLVADGAAIDEVAAADAGISSRLLAMGRS